MMFCELLYVYLAIAAALIITRRIWGAFPYAVRCRKGL